MKKTFSTSFPPIVKRIRLAVDAGGYMLDHGTLMKILKLEELPDGGVVVDMAPVPGEEPCFEAPRVDG